MSELQAALLAIGFAVIVFVYGAGWWQQRRYQRKFGDALKLPDEDALYHDAGSTGESAPLTDASPAEDSARPAPAVDAWTEAPAVPTVAAEDVACSMAGPCSDFLIELDLPVAAQGAALDTVWQRKFDFGKPVMVCGKQSSEAPWERVHADGAALYKQFRIALQLVDRRGALTSAKLAEFRDVVQDLAKRLHAECAVPDLAASHTCALELDAFCARVDRVIGINLIPGAERLIHSSRIAQIANLYGMTLESDGTYHVRDGQGHTLFKLCDMNNMPLQLAGNENFSASGLTLLLDVPQVAHPTERFNDMIELAYKIADALHLNLVDDNLVALSDGGISLIRSQVHAIDGMMEAQGLLPGSAQAKRLFA